MKAFRSTLPSALLIGVAITASCVSPDIPLKQSGATSTGTSSGSSTSSSSGAGGGVCVLDTSNIDECVVAP
jgi:hypothetical protein